MSPCLHPHSRAYAKKDIVTLLETYEPSRRAMGKKGKIGTFLKNFNRAPDVTYRVSSAVYTSIA